MSNVDYSKAYTYMRDRILRGQYRSGTPLKPDRLAVEMGISRTPIREALRQLEAEGLVSILPRLGASVRMLDSEDLRELCGLRMALELFAAGLAAEMRTELDLGEIVAAHETLGREIERMIADSRDATNLPLQNSDKLVRLEFIFHVAIISAAKNRLIKKQILQQNLITRILGLSPWGTMDVPTPSNKDEEIAFLRSTYTEHEAICDAIRRRDPKGARNAMELHLQQGVDVMLRRMARGEAGQMAGEFSPSGSESDPLLAL